MKSTEKTYYDIRRLHLWMAVSSLALLGVTVWMLTADHNRQWKRYQRTFQDEIEPRRTEARIAEEESRESPDREELDRLRRILKRQEPSFGKRLLRLPLIDALARPLAIEQIWLPDLTIDYNFGEVARFDRCVTCHQGIDQTTAEHVSYPAFPGGLPHPYRAHPRRDLFVGSSSPHPMAEFGCTICHDGQGSATEFQWASHAPDDPAQGERWRKEYGWFDDPHWDLPMLPKRFVQSRCLKCHHEVTDLEPSRRWPKAPAEKLVAGYELVRRNGCFGCHEIKGFDLPSAGHGDALPNGHGRSMGPDMRLEPSDGEACGELPPGTMRKVGPSLRGVAGRLDGAFLESWIGNPREFRPNTRMPRFYGLHEHLDGDVLEETQRFEAVEIRAIAEYLLAAGKPVEPQAAPPEVTQQPSVERGKRLFEIQGCLACHRHEDFPQGRSVQGPDLSRLGSKYTTEAGQAWLASWIRDPARHSPRTLMPNPLLQPVALEAEGSAAGGAPAGVSDPAADIAAYLVDCTGWEPKRRAALDETDLDQLARLYLGQADGDTAARLRAMSVEEKLREVGRRAIGRRGCYGCHDVPGFEDAQPIGPALTDWGRKQESLLVFGEIDRFVRSAVPADAKRANPARAKRSNPADAERPNPADDERSNPADDERANPADNERSNPADDERANPADDERSDGVGRSSDVRLAAAGTAAPGTDSDRGFFLDALLAHRREGFLWQKLRAPRSFDFKTAAEKNYDQRLTMCRFEFTEAEREAIITFVLGLVAEPPAEKYVYRPDGPRKAIIEGRKVLEKYACAECHVLEMGRWSFEFDPEVFEDPPPAEEDYPFLRPEVSADAIAASLRTDNRGLGTAEVVGMPRVDAEGELVIVDEDEDQHGNPIYQYSFTLWEPAVLNGKVWPAGADLLVCGPQLSDGRLSAGRVDLSYWGAGLTGIRGPRGGALARLLLPTVLEEARASGGRPLGPEAWSWVPPALVGEGAKVRPDWLYDYLLSPEPIRPACVLRMPRYNMSPEEAGKLVDYFAAAAGAGFPYASDARSRSAYIEAMQRKRPGRMDDAVQLLTASGTDCVKCHMIGDYSPGGQTGTTLAPDLERVGRRIRAEYLRRWLANPRAVLPYTPMTVNFPPTGPPLEPELFEGKTREQLDAMMDLLLNYDWYLRRRASIGQLVPAEKSDGSSQQE